MTPEPYTDELPPAGSTRYVRLDGMVREVTVQPYDERLRRKAGGCVSVRTITGVYRNFLSHEPKESASDFPAEVRQELKPRPKSGAKPRKGRDSKR
jgi:uncharacterized protein YraI